MLATAPRYLFLALYAAALLMFLDQAAEVFAVVLPDSNLANPQVRFGIFGLIIGRTTPAVMIDVLVVLAAIGLQHRRMLKFWGIAHIIVAALLLAGLALFILDVVQLRTVVTQDAVGVLMITAVRSAVMVILAVIYCIWVLIAANRAARRASSVDKHDDEGPVLVTGS
jgi:hypothetical protein